MDGTTRYERVKSHVLKRIESGRWQSGQRIQSEHELVAALGVARMTVNRAIRELVQAGVLRRVAGSGTFVADQHAAAHPLQIRNIAADIRARGHSHRARVLKLERCAPSAALRARLALAPAQRSVFHSVVLHLENGVPLQLEDRYVNPRVAPGYLDLDLGKTTAYEYLTRVAPLASVEHVVRATLPTLRLQRALALSAHDAVLLIERTTWSGGLAASHALLHHAGARFELRGRFNPAIQGNDHEPST